MRRLKPDGLLKIDRPFAIFVQPADDVEGVWNASIVGHELDNVTYGMGPEHAVAMALDLLSLLTGYCTHSAGGIHDWSGQGSFIEHDCDGTRTVPGPRCVHCGEVVRETELVEDS